MRSEISGDLQADRPQATGHQVRCIGTQVQLLRFGLPGPPDQPGDVRFGPAQRDLILAGRRRGNLCDQLRPVFGTAACQVDQAAPHLRILQGGSAAESPQAALLRRHGVGLDDALRTAGDYPDGGAQFSGCGGAEQPLGPAKDTVLHPQQRSHRR